MGVIMGLSDRVGVVDYVRNIGDGTPDEVRNNQEVIDAYLGVSHDYKRSICFMSVSRRYRVGAE